MSNDSNDVEWARYAKLLSTIGKLLLDGRRRVGDLNSLLQGFVSDPRWVVGTYESDPSVTMPPTPKFELLVDLGEIVVPEDYDHTTALTTFHMQHRGAFYSYSEEITDVNFPNPSRVLRPGERLGVQAFRQTLASTSSEERLAFLANQDAVLTGAQGASLVWKQKRALLPKNKWYLSMDQKERLPLVVGYHGVPSVDASSNGGFLFRLEYFEKPWDDGHVLLCFRDLSKPSAT